MRLSTKILSVTVLAAGVLLSSSDAFAWGAKGHDVTCAIAEQHLTKKAQKQISEIFDGKSIIYWANWMDNASHSPEYAYTKTWHYRDCDPGEDFETMEPEPTGDVVLAINAQIEALKSGTLNHEAQAIALRMLVHLVGDLHCPMHMGHKSDAGGNRWQVQSFGNGKNLHSVWDSDMVENAHKWTYSEWVYQIDRLSKAEQEAIVKGNPMSWGKETYLVAQMIYDETPVGTKISYDEVARWTPVVEQQFLRGGLRLASILNEIFK